MKFLNLLILALFFCACTTSSGIKKSERNTEKVIPVFMTNGQQRTAFKTTLDAKGKTYNFLMLTTKKEVI